MKKKSLLLAISAMSIAAIGVGTVGTFAWYQVNSQTAHTLTPETGSITVGYTAAGHGGFTFVLDDLQEADANAVDLTNAAGKSFVFVDATHTQEVTPAHPTKEWSGLTWKVNYLGPSDTAAKIQVEWNELITRYPTASVAVTSNEVKADGNKHVVRFGAAGSTAAQCLNGPFSLVAANVNLSTISWTGVTPGGSGPSSYTAQMVITEKLSKTAFATALTALETNEGAFPNVAPTDGFTVATTLNAAGV